MNALFKIFKLETPTPVIEENAVDTNMAQRPLLLDDYIGQDFIREQVRLKVNLAKKTGAPMTHTLLLGYSGAGKTTLAKIIANELGVDFHECMAANIKTEVDFYHLMQSIVTEGMVLFIDEIHAMKKEIQEMFYTAMEDFCYYIRREGGGHVRIEFPRFTVIGATTHAGNLNQPFLERFGWKPSLLPYTIEELSRMINNSALKKYNVDLDKDLTESMAKICQSTPRRAMHLLKNLHDYVEGTTNKAVLSSEDYNLECLEKTIKGLDLDPFLGLDRCSRQYLNVLNSEKGKAIGSKSLAGMINQQEINVINMIEPFLSQPDIEIIDPTTSEIIDGALVKVTRQGRVATPSTVAYLKLCKQLQIQHGWFPGERFDVE